MNLLKHWEGFKLEAYKDVGGVWTIGYGHTGPEVHSGMKITTPVAEALLREDIKEAEKAVRQICDSDPVEEEKLELSNNQYSALVCFVYNIGAMAFEGSTLASYLADTLTEELDPAYVATQLRRWNKVKGRIVQGLVNRREAEIKLWYTPDAAS